METEIEGIDTSKATKKDFNLGQEGRLTPQ